jgi:hypothetical protein
MGISSPSLSTPDIEEKGLDGNFSSGRWRLLNGIGYGQRSEEAIMELRPFIPRWDFKLQG